MIELGARYLPRHGTLVMHRLEEIERPRLFPRGVCELNAVLPHEWTGFQFFKQAETAERPVSVSHQRFADVMTWKNFLLEENYLAALARQNTGNRTPRGPTTHYDDVKFIVCIHA